VPPGDAAAFAEALVSLAADPELRQGCGSAARDRALGRYGAERLLKDIDVLYGTLVAARGAATD
jgi:glycosyltransferase involved in cell wall biosynthesis